MLGLENKVAVITGGTRGLGKAIAKEFGIFGAKVVIAARDQVKGERTLNELREFIKKCIFIKTDVTKYQQVEDLIFKTINELGGIDFMINNAAIFIGNSVVDIKNEDWQKILDVNMNGVFYCTKVAAKEMIKQGRGGRIVNVSSIIGVTGKIYCSAYTATKGAINSFTKNVAIDLAKYNILVNSIVPGVCDTEINAPIKGAERRKSEAKIPLNRWAKPEEVAKGVIYLCSNLSTYVTGHNLVVDGGYTAGKEISEIDSVLNKNLLGKN